MKALVVRNAFGDYAVGALITDPAKMAEVRESGHDHNCTPTDVDAGFFKADAEPKAEPKPVSPPPPPPQAEPKPAAPEATKGE